MSDDFFEEFDKQSENIDPFRANHSTAGWVIIGVIFFVSSVLWFFAGPHYFYRFVAPPANSTNVETEANSSLTIPGNGTVPGRNEGEMAILFLNVGFGDGILIQAPDNRTSLIDGGEGTRPHDEGVEAYDSARELHLPLLDDLGVPSLHRLVSTTPRSHHMGAQADLIADAQLSIEQVLITGYPASFYSYRRRKLAAREREVKIRVMKPEDEINFGPGIKSIVLHGDASAKFPKSASHVLLVQYGDIRFLLMSDLPTEQEKQLVLEWGESLDADVLKIGSHGSRESSSLELLRFVDPGQAVISVSRQNPINAPHEETIKRLKKAGISDSNLYRTDIDGHIGFYTDGAKIRVETNILPNY